MRAELQPLLSHGWKLLGEKIKIVFDGRTEVDIDLLVKSPHGIGFSIDAKNVNASIKYKPGERRLDHRIEFTYSRFRPPKTYPIAQALASADWARDNPGFSFPKGKNVNAVMCFVENDGLHVRERNAYGLHLVKISNLVATLQTLDAAQSNS